MADQTARTQVEESFPGEKTIINVCRCLITPHGYIYLVIFFACNKLKIIFCITTTPGILIPLDFPHTH